MTRRKKHRKYLEEPEEQGDAQEGKEVGRKRQIIAGRIYKYIGVEKEKKIHVESA